MSLNLIEQFEARCGALKVSDLTEPLGMDDKTIYRMAARGLIPSFRLGGAIRFDPQEIANWLRAKYSMPAAHLRKPPLRAATAASERKISA